MIALLEDYITVLNEADVKSQFSQSIPSVNYYLPADIVSSDEWAEFDNVYQVHCPSVFLDSAVRDVCRLLFSAEMLAKWLYPDHDAILLLLQR